MTVIDLANAITLMQQWQLFMTASAINPDSYIAILSKWGVY